MPFFDEQPVIVVPPNHAWAKRKALKLEELDGKSLIMCEKKNSSPLIGAFIEVLKEHRPKLARYGT